MLFKNILYRLILITFAFVCVIIFTSNQIVAQEQKLSCIEDLPGCNDWQSSQRTINITNCPVTFYYDWRSCPDPNCPGKFITQMYVYMLSWSPTQECETFTRCIFPNWPSMDPIDWNCANNAFKNGMRGITVQNFLDMYNQTPTEPPILRQMLECEGNPCQLPDNCEGSTTDAFEGFCASYCLSYTPIATGGDGKVYIKKDECTENGSGCCLYKRNHCYCKATGEVLVRETITPAQGDCVPERRPIPSCPPGFYFYQSDCMVNCP